MASSSTPLLVTDHPSSPPPPPDAPSASTVPRWKRTAQSLFTFLDPASNGCSVSQTMVQLSVLTRNPSSTTLQAQETTSTTTTTMASGTRDKIRVVFLSDMHFNGAHGGPATSGGEFVCASGELLDDVVRAVNGANADVIIFGGDFVDADGNKYAQELAESYLGKMHARYGSFAVLGNHDQFVPGSRNAVVAALRNVGITVLDNECVRPHPSLEIVGVGDCTTKGDFNPSEAFISEHFDPDTAPTGSIPVSKYNESTFRVSYPVGGLTEKSRPPLPCCRIAVTHNPDAAPQLMAYPAHIILSGHTHGGQACLPGSRRRPIAAWLYEDCSSCCCCCCGGSWLKKKVWPIYRSFTHWDWSNGLHLLRRGDGTDHTTERFLFVTNGIGSHSPGRFLCPPEVAIIDITLKESEID